MNSAIGYSLDPVDLVVVGGVALVLVAAVVLVVRALTPRRGWSADAAAALTWSSAAAVVSVMALLFIQPWRQPSGANVYVGSYAPLEAPDWALAESAALDVEPLSAGVPTLVWMPCVMALLWSVLHVLRSGTGHHSPLLGLPPLLAVPALWLVTAPLQITVLTIGILGLLSWTGLVVYLVGQALVATGRSWVGDVAVWTGIALVAADAWPGYVGLVSPLVVAALVLYQRSRPAPAAAPVRPVS